MAKVELKKLFKTYNKKIKALEDINLTIEDGQFFVLLGPSGAGKTTTLRCIAGLEKIDSGDVLFNDENITHDQPASRDVSFVFQQYSLYPHYTVYENLAFPLRSPMRKLPEEEIKNIELEYRSKLENQLEDSKKSEKTRITNFMSDEWSDYESVNNLQMNWGEIMVKPVDTTYPRLKLDKIAEVISNLPSDKKFI